MTSWTQDTYLFKCVRQISTYSITNSSYIPSCVLWKQMKAHSWMNPSILGHKHSKRWTAGLVEPSCYSNMRAVLAGVGVCLPPPHQTTAVLPTSGDYEPLLLPPPFLQPAHRAPTSSSLLSLPRMVAFDRSKKHLNSRD